YVSASSNSTDFPTRGAFQSTNAGDFDCVVAKIKPDGNGLDYSTYLGGSAFDACVALAVDIAGAAYVTGEIGSTDFPLKNAFQTALNGTDDAVITKIKPDGSDLVYSTYLGGSQYDAGYAIAVDAAGGAYLTGNVRSYDFPFTPGVVQ